MTSRSNINAAGSSSAAAVSGTGLDAQQDMIAANGSLAGGNVAQSLKRPLALNGISSTVEDKNIDFMCPICFDLIVEAHITRCGHTFCYQCISKSIESFKRCPKCNAALSTQDTIFPNYLLGELISKYKLKLKAISEMTSRGAGKTSASSGQTHKSDNELKNFITSESEKLALPDVNVILDILTQRKQLLESESCTSHNRLLYEFLKQLSKRKHEQAAQIAKEIDLINRDMTEVKAILKECTPAPVDMHQETVQLLDKMETSEVLTAEDGFNTYRTNQPSATFLARKRRMYEHFDDFVKSYFSTRSQDVYIGNKDEPQQQSASSLQQNSSSNCSSAGSGGTNTVMAARQGLDVFRENLVKFSKYNSLRCLASMYYSSDLQNNSTIVSTIVFDKDNEYFAIGGVTKRIKIFDYYAVIRDTVDIHYPTVEMISHSKISCITWNSYHKNILATSDYEGAVNIWDVHTGIRTISFHEHEKRCWSVDFNDVDSRLIASGSDDARVKLWSTNEDRSIATLEVKGNVCCVKFNPKSSCHLAFGSADHDVHYYDLRNMSKPICIFKGHKKAVSYVKFLNTEEIVSASTDSNLKLWNVNSPPYCLRSFNGHINDKNFVGLATDGDYLACGSEDNSLYVYYKGLSKQLFNYKIDENKYDEAEIMSDPNEFVSAVCWRKKCNVILAANSRGLIQILELV